MLMDEECEGPERLTYRDGARVHYVQGEGCRRGRRRNVVDVRRARERAGLLDFWKPKVELGERKD